MWSQVNIIIRLLWSKTVDLEVVKLSGFLLNEYGVDNLNIGYLGYLN